MIKELLQTYQMEYSTNIFSAESNLKDPAKREALELKNNLQSVPAGKPLLLTILQKYTKSKKKPIEKKEAKAKP